ncbi:MAG: hypothetical protein ABH832_00255 [bacterium]
MAEKCMCSATDIEACVCEIDVGKVMKALAQGKGVQKIQEACLLIQGAVYDEESDPDDLSHQLQDLKTIICTLERQIHFRQKEEKEE